MCVTVVEGKEENASAAQTLHPTPYTRKPKQGRGGKKTQVQPKL